MLWDFPVTSQNGEGRVSGGDRIFLVVFLVSVGFIPTAPETGDGEEGEEEEVFSLGKILTLPEKSVAILGLET